MLHLVAPALRGPVPFTAGDLIEGMGFMEPVYRRAVLFGRSSPGPVGLYIVSVGYAVRGVPGAVVGWLALASPAFLAIPMLALLRRWLHLSRVRSALDAVIIASATLLVPSGLLLARDAVAQIASFF